ncbi:NfeD family protein [Wenzhouxiangella sp. EGI_FJ10305]|uniref:NfeD family protein n=1 Tax=Wenzhouxiangella sp. EGI_FJ10305 TaxID=3243768 RepID=UPI0035D7CF08
MIEQSWFWLILGALLVLSEFFITGIVAIFFGIGALLVGIATAVGLLDSPPEQVIVFAVLSVGSLLFARERIRVWFRGNVSDRWDGDKDLIATRGERVTVTRRFSDGVGRVRLSGAEWKAECDEGEFEEGDTAWVVGHRGITLLVSANRPDPTRDHAAS